MLYANWSVWCQTYFIDHCISEGLLVSSGGFAVVHLHRHDSDPQLLLFAVVLHFPSAHLQLVIPNLTTQNRLNVYISGTLMTQWLVELQEAALLKDFFQPHLSSLNLTNKKTPDSQDSMKHKFKPEFLVYKLLFNHNNKRYKLCAVSHLSPHLPAVHHDYLITGATNDYFY